MYTKPFVLAGVANFLFFTNLNVYTLLPLYIQALGGRAGQIGTIMAMYSVAAVLCQAGIGPLLDRWGRKPFMLLAAGLVVRFLGGRLADRFGRRQVILPSLAGLAAGILLFSVLHSTWLLLVIALINGASQGFVYPATSALAFDRAPSGARGRALAAYNMAALTGGAFGAIGFGWMVELLGYRQGFVVAGLILVTGALLFWRRR